MQVLLIKIRIPTWTTKIRPKIPSDIDLSYTVRTWN